MINVQLSQFLLVKLCLQSVFSCTLFMVAIGNPAIKRMYFLKLAKRLECKSSSGIIEFLAADLVTLSPDLTLLQTNHILGDQPVCRRDAMKMKSFSQQCNRIFLLSDALCCQQWTKEYGRPHWLQSCFVTLTECSWMWTDLFVCPIFFKQENVEF